MTVAGAAMGVGILLSALARTRELAFRMTSGTNLSGIGKTCLIYANDHDDKLPPDLQTLVKEVELSPKSLESKRKPKDFDGPSFIYIPGQTRPRLHRLSRRPRDDNVRENALADRPVIWYK